MTNNPQTQSTRSATAPGRGKRGLLISLAILLLILATLSYSQRHLLQSRFFASDDQPLVRSLLRGETLTLTQEDYQDFTSQLVAINATQDARLQESLNDWLAQEALEVRQAAEAGVNNYLDWYYSLTGSYLRLFVAVTGDLDELLIDKMQQHLLDDSQLHTAWREHLSAINPQVVATWQTLGEGYVSSRLDDLQEEFRQREKPQHAKLADDDPRIEKMALQQDLQNWVRPSEMDLRRWQISAGSGALVGAAIALPTGRLMAARLASAPAAQAASRIIRRYLARLPARLAIQSATSGAAAAATAPSGPGALLTGIGVFTAMTAADWALLKMEEIKYRDELQSALLEEIETSFIQNGQQRIKNQLNRYQQGREQQGFYLLHN
ncbi:hypothetical protein [Marinospirillum sp.]|uniref:hypothetical protein n=1 Tax=Marinospirillum sp. TaxID=2183934 RepID=UPI00287053C5|nr:hypothetical protein [Marinospirillum sp.]MDR9467740.1 hypothetical protein [Marinospirillum sp.]